MGLVRLSPFPNIPPFRDSVSPPPPPHRGTCIFPPPSSSPFFPYVFAPARGRTAMCKVYYTSSTWRRLYRRHSVLHPEFGVRFLSSGPIRTAAHFSACSLFIRSTFGLNIHGKIPSFFLGAFPHRFQPLFLHLLSKALLFSAFIVKVFSPTSDNCANVG